MLYPPLGRQKRRWDDNIKMDERDKKGWWGLDLFGTRIETNDGLL
jgi:hypothetical protein